MGFTLTQGVNAIADLWDLDNDSMSLAQLGRDLRELFLIDRTTKEILQGASSRSDRLYLGVIGEIGAGKGELSAYLRSRHGALVEGYSVRTRELLRRCGHVISRSKLQEMAMHLIEYFGPDILTRPILHSVLFSQAPIVCVEGIRMRTDVEALSRLPGFQRIFVTAPLETRYARRVAAGTNAGDAEKTFADFQREGEAANEREIVALGAEAEHQIDNSGTLAEFHEKIDRLMEQLAR